MRSVPIARDFGSSPQTLDWLTLYWFDLATLAFATAAVTRLWLGYFDVRQPAMLLTLSAAALIDLLRRAVAARRTFVRPAIFSGERRQDLLTAILLAVGPWPMLPAPHLPAIDAAWPLAPKPLLMAIPAAVVAGIVMSIIVGRILLPHRIERFAVRQLRTIPAPHVASLLVLPNDCTA
jgi:hypothetical protein